MVDKLSAKFLSKKYSGNETDSLILWYVSFSVTTITKERVAVQQSSHNDIRSVWSIDYWKPDLIHRFRATSNQRKRDAFSMTHVNTILSTVVQFSSFFYHWLPSRICKCYDCITWQSSTSLQPSTHLDVSAPPGLEDDMSDSISSRAAEGIEQQREKHDLKMLQPIQSA